VGLISSGSSAPRITNSYFVGACTGRSAGFSPLRTKLAGITRRSSAQTSVVAMGISHLAIFIFALLGIAAAIKYLRS
jgi:hypothetical protein